MTVKKGRSKSEEKRGQVIAAASELFLEQGYEKCSMEEIARLAGVSKQTLYSHFGSKEQLFSDAIATTCEQYQVWSQNAENKSPQQFLEAFCVNFALLLVSREAIGVLRVCISEAGRSQVAELFWQAGPANIRRQLRDFLSREHQRGNLQIDDIDTAVSQLIAMLHGEAHTRLILGVDGNVRVRELENYAKACAGLFLKAYQA